MDYKTTINQWLERFSFFLQCSPRSDDLNALLFPLLGLSQAKHMAYLSGKEPVPEYITNAIELFELLPAAVQFYRAANKLAPNGWPNESTDKIISMCVSKWNEATGIELYGSGPESIGRDWNPYSVRKVVKVLVEYDPSGLAGILYLESCMGNLKAYLEERNGSDGHKYSAMLCLDWLLRQGQIQAVKEVQISQLKSIVSELRAGKLTENDEKLLKFFPAEITLDAYKSFKSFKRFTVPYGSSIPETPPVYVKNVYRFESAEDLVSKMQAMPIGFALCVISGRQQADSYFTIAIRTADALHLVSDQPQYEYPLMSEMLSSRNDRFNLFRMEDSYLPYELLNIRWSDDGKKAMGSSCTELVASDGLHVIGNISTRHSASTVWLCIMFQLCFERYFIKGGKDDTLALVDYSQVLQLSGTNPDAGGPEHNLPAVVESCRHVLQPLASKEITRTALNEAFPEIKPHRVANAWMEKKFAAKVDSSKLYLLPGTAKEQLLLGESASNSTTMVVGAAKKQLKMLNTSVLVTPEQAQNDGLFIARYNQSLMINQLAKQDFEDRKTKVLHWVYEKMAAYVPQLIDKLAAFDHAAVSIKPMLRKLKDDCTGLSVSQTYREIYLVKTTLSTYLRAEEKPSLESSLRLYDDHEYLCYLSHSYSAKYRICLEVSNACDLSLLTGVPIAELPDELQNYGLTNQDRPGLMLDIADPLEVLKNPWDDLKINYRIPVSLNALNERRKQLHLPKLLVKELPINYWEKGFNTSEQDKARIQAILNINSMPGGMNMYPSSNYRPPFSYV